MEDRFSRSRMLLGEEAMKKLAASRVAVFGVGGVGGYVVEALARSGVGELDLIDNDRVVLSNLNRQIIATMDTVGRDKVDVMAQDSLIFLSMTMLWMPSIRSQAKSSSSCRQRRQGSRSSAPWARAIRWTHPALKSRIFTRRRSILWPG